MQLSCRALHARKTPCVLLKVDIARAFESVSWQYLLEVLQHLGFSRRWCNWISIMLSTASTRIPLNGRPGRRICHARGLRPVTHVGHHSDGYVLNRLLICMDLWRFLTPLPCMPIRYWASLYVDDIVLFVAPLVADLTALKTSLEIFATASGLYTNLDKCVATPIHCSQEQIDLVSETMTCAVADFP